MIVAVDPGSALSAYVSIGEDYRPMLFGKVPNHELLNLLGGALYGPTVIEMVASYGMPVGREVFDTCVWIGRFFQRLEDADITPALVPRQPVRSHHCHSQKANDATVRRALVDRFSYGTGNHGKGTKAHPGFFHGFAADTWQAFALAVYALDKARGIEAP